VFLGYLLGKSWGFTWHFGYCKVLTGAFYVGLLDGLLGVAGMIIDSFASGSFPKIPS